MEGALRIVRIAREWIGTPYVHQASVKHAGCDCLGLLRGVWRELHGEEPQPVPPYSEDWAEATGEETLANALRHHMREIDKADIATGDVAVFRMASHAPAKHCGVVAFDEASLEPLGRLTLIHARQNKRVSEEPLHRWRRNLAYAFRL